MTETTTVVAIPGESPPTSFDWGAIIGGALLASVLTAILLSFGSAAGFASFSLYSWNNPSATTLTIIGVAWFSVVMIGSALAGGYFTGRFRRRTGTVPLDERQARDAAHGLLMWAVSFIVGMALAYMVVAGTARGAASAVGQAAAGVAQTIPQDRAASIVDTMMRPSPGAEIDNPRGEVARVLTTDSLMSGSITDADRNYIAGIVAAEAKISPEEARKRVDTTIEQATQAAETARKAAAWLAFLIGAVSILAAGAAVTAARLGGKEREENIWR